MNKCQGFYVLKDGTKKSGLCTEGCLQNRLFCAHSKMAASKKNKSGAGAKGSLATLHEEPPASDEEEGATEEEPADRSCPGLEDL